METAGLKACDSVYVYYYSKMSLQGENEKRRKNGGSCAILLGNLHVNEGLLHTVIENFPKSCRIIEIMRKLYWEEGMLLAQCSSRRRNI